MQKRITDYDVKDLIKLAVGAGAYSSSPVWGGKGNSPASNPYAATSGNVSSFGAELGKSLAPVGKAIWNNGGKQVANTGLNTLHGIGTTATGLANTAAGGIGSTVAAPWQAGARLSDAVGATTGATSMADAFAKPMNQAFVAGGLDTFGGAADTLSGGKFNYDGTPVLGGPPTEPHPGTAVEQMRSGMRDQLGRDTPADIAFRTTNAIGDFAASTAALGGVGRGLNIGAKALQGSRVAAPVLNAAAKTPVVGKPLTAVGNWMAGPAPAANMFTKTPVQYAKAVGARSLLLEGANAHAQFADSSIDRPAEAREYNEVIRPHVEDAFTNQSIIQQMRRGDNTDYNMTAAMMGDPAMANRMQHGAIPQEVAPQLVQQSGVFPPEQEADIAANISANAPSLTAPEATQPNPQGGPSTAQKPPSGPTQVLNTEEVQAAPGEAPLGHVSANEADEAFFANPDLYHRDEAAAVREYRANKQQPPKTELQTQPSGPATEPTSAAPAPAQPAAAQSVATPVSTPVSTHVGTADQTFEPELVTQIQNAKTPEEQQVAQQAAAGKVQQIVASDPVGGQGVQDLQSGKTDTAAAKEVQGRIDAAESQRTAEELENLKKAHPEADISDPKTYGIFLSQAAEKAKSLPFEHKLLMGLGLGGGLIGILSSLFGDTGMAGGLLGMLGLAVGGAAGAAGGVFGNQAQAATGKMMGDVGNFMGMIPNEARDANNFRPGSAASKAFEAKVRNTFLSGDAAAAQKMVDDRTAQFAPLEQAYATSPSLAHTYLMGTENGPKTPEEAEALYQQMLGQVTQARALSKNTTAARGAINSAGAAVGDAYNSAGAAVTGAVNSVGDWWNNIGKGASMNIAQQIFFKQAAQKAARCWAGYEPVPGKAPHSDNSCRPKRKKKTEKKAEEYSAQPFNPAIGYKHPNAKASLMDVYKNQMYRSGQEVAKKTKDPNYQYSNDYNMAVQHYGGLMPRPPVAPVSPGQMAAPAAPVAPAQPPAVKLPRNPGPRNPTPAFKGRIRPPAVAPAPAATGYTMGPPVSK